MSRIHFSNNGRSFRTLMKNINLHTQKLNEFQVEKHKEIHNQIHHSKNVNLRQRNRF